MLVTSSQSDKQPLVESNHGILFSTRVKTFTVNRRGRSNQGEESGYVFCSALTPAIMAEKGNQTVAFLLAPFAQQQSRENTNFYTLYFAMCHGTEAGKMAARDWQGVAQSLRYDSRLNATQTVTLSNPEEIVNLPPR